MIEGALRKSGDVQQVFVHGEPGASALVAVAVPAEALLREAEQKGQSGADACAASAARAAVLAALHAAGRQAGLKARTVLMIWRFRVQDFSNSRE